MKKLLLTCVSLVLPLIAAHAEENKTPITIYVANKVITMDPMRPEGTAVAVKEGKIYSVGSVDEMKKAFEAGSYTVNTDFATQTITPGFIEAHAHWSMLLVLLGQPYVGHEDFLGYDATVLPGVKSKAAVIESLKEANKKITDPNAPLFAWGYDPTLLNNEELLASELDTISTTRPIFVLNASGHIGYANHLMLSKAGISAASKTQGVMKGADGKLNGTLMELEAMEPVLTLIMPTFFTEERLKKGIAGVAMLGQRVGITTTSDLFFGGVVESKVLPYMQAAAADPSYPVRVVAIYGSPYLTAMDKKSPGSGLAHLNDLEAKSTDKLRFGGVKFISDGSIQGFTARLDWPGYFNGHGNGIFNTTTEMLKTQALPLWQAGHPIHIHVNGTQATDSALDALEYLQTKAPRRNPLYVLEHDQLSTPEQFKRAHELGASVNLFANQIYYWGDVHESTTVGPDRAHQMDNVAEAKRAGLIYSIHSDAPITPLNPLHVMWAAVNRTTLSGKTLGTEAKATAEDALRAMTINAAYLLDIEKEIGSIEVGKRADFTILARNPLIETTQTLKDIPVVATVQGGVVHKND